MANEVTIHVTAKDQTGPAFDSAKKGATGFGKVLGDVGKIAGGFLAAGAIQAGVGALLGGFSSSVKAASDLGESLNAVNKIFGDSADKILKWGDESANAFGLSQRAFNQMATPLGAMLKNSGLAMDQVADRTIELTKRASDMASVFNTDVEDALGAITAALRGESDPIEKFGVSLNAAAIEAKALEMGLVPVEKNMTQIREAQIDVEKAQRKAKETAKEYGKNSLEARDANLDLTKAQEKLSTAMAGSTGELTSAIKQQAAYALIMEQTESVAGDFASTSDDLANKTRIQKARQEELQAVIGEKLIPVQLKLTEIKLKLVDAIATKVIPVLEELYRKHWPAVQLALVDVEKAIGDVVAFVKEHWPEISAVMGFVADYVSTRVEGMIQVIGAIVEIVTSVVNLVSALVHGDWSRAWNEMKDIAAASVDLLIGYLKATLGNIPQIALGLVSEAADAGLALGKGLANGVIRGVNSLLNRLSGSTLIPAISAPLIGEVTPAVRIPSLGTIPELRSGHPFIPFDNFPAMLHKGERVLTAEENARGGMGGSVVVNVYGSILSERELVRIIRDNGLNGGFSGVFAPA